MTQTSENRVIIFDTTLRDGEQSPGATMNAQEKLMIAEALDAMGVDVIEAGFAIASSGDSRAIRAIAEHVKNASVCSLARAVKADIDAAAEAIRPAVKPRIHTFISTSPIHMEYKLKMSPEQVLEAIKDSVSHARSLCEDVEWSCEDGSRTEHDFLCKSIETAITAGASTINIPDTVGYAMPEEYAALIRMVMNRVPNIDKAIISVHCHNDLGLAVANSLAAVTAGARQIECTMNGLGERAGNAALEELVMAIRTRPDLMPYATGVNSEHITKVSRLVSTVTGFLVQNNKAIVGANAFAHESGIHQHGMIANAETYEIMTPESVGLTQSSLVMGKHSGRHAFRQKMEELGMHLNETALDETFKQFKELADRKKEIYDEDLIALVNPSTLRTEARVKLKHLQVVCGTEGPQQATLELQIDGKLKRINEVGNGPVDAIFNAIKGLAPHNAWLHLYQVHSITQGSDAQAEVTVRLAEGDKLFNGYGADPDTLTATARAYISALNNVMDHHTRADKAGSSYSDLQKSGV